MSKMGQQSHYRPRTNRTVAYTGTSARTSAGISAQIRAVRLVATTDCFVAIGNSAVTATTSDMLLPALTPEYFTLGEGDYVAAIQSATGGTLHVTELSQ